MKIKLSGFAVQIFMPGRVISHFSYPRVLGHEICGEIIESGKTFTILISDSKLR
ncbi:hypothetical protein DMI62_01965 [Escherichia coli]|nr:hypothetical protein [Escherichia coli]